MVGSSPFVLSPPRLSYLNLATMAVVAVAAITAAQAFSEVAEPPVKAARHSSLIGWRLQPQKSDTAAERTVAV